MKSTPEKREKHAAYMKKWAAANPEYRMANSKSRVQRAKKQKSLDPENFLKKAAQASAKYRRKNRPKILCALHKWRKENPEAFRRYANKRRALKAGSTEHYTDNDISDIKHQQNHRCAYCQKSIKGEYVVDHIIPLSSCGSNGRRNIQLTCDPCNRKKHCTDPVTFARKIGLLI